MTLSKEINDKRILSLDVLRGLAILMVVMSHNPIFPESRGFWYYPVVAFHKIGWAGVDLFFVLSGYLVGGLLIAEFRKTGAIRVKRFIIRRAYKIWPVYYVCVLTFLIVKCVKIFLNRDPGSIAELWLNHIPNFIHFQNYFSSTSDLGWLWSLGVEEHFYVLVPLLIPLFLIKGSDHFSLQKAVGILIGCITIALIFRKIAMIQYPIENVYHHVFPTHLRFDSLAAGVLLAAFEAYNGRLIKLSKIARGFFLVSGLALISTPFFLSGKQQFFAYPYGLTFLLLGFLFILVFASHYKTRMGELRFSDRTMVSKMLLTIALIFAWIGVRSYSIYVWSGFLAKPIANRICKLFHLVGDEPYWGILAEAVYVAVPIAIGFISFHLIEIPFIKYRDRKPTESSSVKTAPRFDQSSSIISPKSVD